MGLAPAPLTLPPRSAATHPKPGGGDTHLYVARWQRWTYPGTITVVLLTLFAPVKVLGPGGAALAVASFTAVTTVMALEWAVPYRSGWAGYGKDSPRDFTHTVVLFPVLGLVAQLSLVAIAQGLGLRPVALPEAITRAPGVEVVLLLLLSELIYYWVHRLFHRVPLLWRLHRVHHQPRRLYWLNSALFHPAEMLVSAGAYAAPLIVFGASRETVLWVSTLSLVTGLLEHANITTRCGALNAVMNTNEMHRWHHAMDLPTTVNYGKALSVWDWVFSTAHCPPDEHVGEVGIAAEETQGE